MKIRLYLLSIALALFAGVQPVPAQTPRLSIASAGNQIVLSWPAAVTNYVLQTTTNLLAAAWSTVYPAPVPVNGQNSVTNRVYGARHFYQLSLSANPSGMARIPAGVFTMGDALDGESDAVPTVSVNVPAFYMDVNLVTISEWQSVYVWATNAGYGFVNAGSGKAENHPVQKVNWYDVVKWCNARSQQAGLAPAYFINTGFSQIYITGETDAVYVDSKANGYRLPTEAQWEKAARGGLGGRRFPWGDLINETLANYYGDTNDFAYDLGPNGFNAAFDAGEETFTSPVGYFPPNGYGLYDMAGNVSEWCWDWYGAPYSGGSDPQGSVAGSRRVFRGGGWIYDATGCRSANRLSDFPSANLNYLGFRCVLPAAP